MKLFKAWAIAIAAAVLCWQSARADIVVTSITRSVLATAGPFGTPDSTSSPLPGMFLASALSMGGAPPESVDADASQGSSTPIGPGPSMAGAGAAGGSVSSPSGSYSLTGDSFFDVFFTVTIDGPFLFDADVSWSGAFPALVAHAFVTLEEDVPADPALSGTTLASVSAGPGLPSADSDTVIVMLTAGTPYQLRAVAHVVGGGVPGTFAIGADFGFSLTAVPEANAWLLTAPIALGLAIAAWRRRQPVAG